MAFIDAQALPDASAIQADLIIIGGGLAGISLAKELAGGPIKVAILEGGGRDIEDDSQALYAGSATMRGPGNADRPLNDFPGQSRVRALGGSAHVWGGKCGPLDPGDFAARDWVPHSGWPMSRQDLQPFYDRACDLMEIPRFGPGSALLNDPARRPLELDPRNGFFPAPRHFSRLSGGADKAAFDRFRTEFASAPNITVYLHANVTQIRLNPAGDAVEGLEIGCLNGKRHTARGKSFVLAAGGIENVRLLLASNGVHAAGIGNEHDLVGRFFQGHVTYSMDGDAETEGSAVNISGGAPLGLYIPPRRAQSHCVIGSGLDGQARRKAGNFTLTLYNGGEPGKGTPTQAETLALRLAATRLDAGQDDGQLVGCFAMTEHFPNPDSRVTLDPDNLDPLGVPRIKLDWAYTARDWESFERSTADLGDALGAAGQGRLCWPVQRRDYVAIASTSRHHMGTTRMHEDPRQGVVDAQCRVHATRNLHIAGSSVFPTSGIVNPTLTLLALALRLADHLKIQMGATR